MMNFIAKLVVYFSLIYSCALASAPKYSVQPSPEYDALFYRRKGWTGADAAYSVALNDNVTLWLFGDTWIGDIVNGRHKNATLVNNSIALQYGKDPAKAAIKFFWRETEQAKPAAFISPADGIGWFWIFDGIIAQQKLYLFLMQIVKTGQKGVFAFKLMGTWLGEVKNPYDEPLQWQIRQLKIPWGRFTEKGNLFFGSAVMKDGDFVYIYGGSEEGQKGLGGRSMIVARVPAEKMTDFNQWRFFSNGRWKTDINNVCGLFTGTATEYSVSYQPAIKRFLTIYSENGMSRNIMMRLCPTPIGPWSRAYKIYECPEYRWHNSYFCYAAKGHPELCKKDELIVTYVCNSTDFWQMAKDARIYRPRFLRIKFDLKQK